MADNPLEPQRGNSYTITPIRLRNTSDFGYTNPGAGMRNSRRPELGPLLGEGNNGATAQGDDIPQMQTRQHPPEHKQEFDTGRGSGRAEDDALPGEAEESAAPELGEIAEALI